MPLVKMPIIMTNQAFGKDDFHIELGQYLSKEELAHTLSLFSMCQKFETSVDKSTKSRLVVKCKHDTCRWRIRARKLKDSNFFLNK